MEFNRRNTEKTAENTRIKICGLRRMEDILCVNRLLPEYIGFVFASKSRRYISPGEAGKLREKLNPRIIPVGVFVDESPDTVADLLSSGLIDIAQLHGAEDESYMEALCRHTDRRVLKAFRIENRDDVRRAQQSSAWCVLADSGEGGTGRSFDWSLLAGLERPCFLAGGLNPENVGEAVRLLHPFAVDVSSGVETDGVKDPAKMEAFVRAVRAECGRHML